MGDVDASITLWLEVAANFVALFTQPQFGKLSDRIGRKPVFIYGALSSALFMPMYLLSLESGNTLLQFLLSVVVFSCSYAAANAVWPSFYGEMFSARVRFSGLAIGTQLGFLMAGFAPSIVAAMGGIAEGGWVIISMFNGAICVIAAVAALTAKETFRTPTAELGHQGKKELAQEELAGVSRG